MKPFYFTWTRQNFTVDFPVQTTELDEFILDDGRKIYDFISTSFQANFGHSDADIQNRITSQLQSMPIASPKSTFELKVTVSTGLVDLVERGPGRIFYTVSGSESVENALKIARQITGRKIILARQKSYHGATLGALSVTGDWRNGPHLTFDEGTVRIADHGQDPDLSKFKSTIEETGPENIAAVILETISGTNGMSMPSNDWFLELESLCRQFGILLILDEVLVGFGRCGHDFAFHKYGLNPDIVCMSKAITGGYVPFGAVWTSAKIASNYEDEVLCCGLTNYGHPLGLAALDAVLGKLNDQEFRTEMRELEQCFSDQLERFRKRSDVREVRIQGLMATVFFDVPAPSWQAGFDAGLHIFSKENFSILAPPYVSRPNRLKQAIERFESLLN